MDEKPKARGAIHASGLAEREIAGKARLPEARVRAALSGSVDAETAGAIARVLAEAAGLAQAGRREIFWELVSSPHDSAEDRRAYVGSEDPLSMLRDAAEMHRPDR